MPKVIIKKLPKAQSGLHIEDNQYKYLSPDIIELGGNYHEDGGTKINYNGTNVEAEKGETISIANDGDAVIYGNMKNPLTNRKFKSDSKILADKAKKSQELIDDGSMLMQEANTPDPFEMLKFNSGKAMYTGGVAKRKQVDASKEWLATLQKTMLDKANELGVNPQKFSHGKIPKAKYGYKAAAGDDVPFSKLNKTAPSFGVKNMLYDFSDADENYTRTGHPLPVTVKGMIPRVNTGGNNPITPMTPNIGIGQPPSSLTGNITPLIDENQYLPDGTINPNDFTTASQNQNTPFSNAKGLSASQILPELYTAATNKQEPVWMQQYNPNLYNAYNVSFQDRRNQNQGTFSALKQQLSNNPAALSTLAGQMYEANNQVGADEFRTNQAIQNDITNKNNSLLNEANQKNLGLADLQYTRQAQAKANTKTQNRVVLQSIADKLHANQLEQQTVKLYENMYPHYRFNERTGKAEIQNIGGSDADNFQFHEDDDSLLPINNNSSENKTINKTDYKGRTSTSVITNPASVTQKNQYQVQDEAWKAYQRRLNMTRMLRLK